MNFREYVEGQKPLYAAFAETVEVIISAALSARTDIASPLLTAHRAKAEESLRRKLEARRLIQSDRIETHIKDLAGCRLVFYTDSDKEAFLRSGIVFDNFTVDRDETKVHHPVPGEPSEETQYRATHYIVLLPESKLAEAAYARFAGLRCEIQIQTLLHHAWSETAHNITYKSSLQPGFGRRHLANIKQRLDSIMTQYLVPAGYEFQKVKNDALLLERGNECLRGDPLSQLRNATDNDERVDLLTSIRELVLPYCDDFKTIHAQLWDVLPQVIAAARTTEPRPIETAVGVFDGKTAYQVTRAGVAIIDYLRYYDVSASLGMYCQLFTGCDDPRESKCILEAVERLASHALAVWRQGGPYVQSVLLQTLGKLDAAQRRTFRPIILAVCAKALEPEVSGTSSPTFNTVTFHRGGVKVSDALRALRSEALSLLETLYGESHTEEEKRSAFDTMLRATRLPSSGAYDDDLCELAIQNARRIVAFSARQQQDTSFELLQHMEHHFCWLYREVPHWAARRHVDLRQEAEALVALITAFRDALNADVAFVRHKTLVGFEGVFDPNWEADGPAIACANTYRLAKFDEYIEAINADTAEQWFRVIKRCAATRSTDKATFASFFEFLARLSAKRPAIMLGYLADLIEELVGFLHGILLALELSAKAKEAEALTQRWISEGRYLGPIARFLRLAKVTHSNLIVSLSRKAIETKDCVAAREVIASVVARPDAGGSALVDQAFVPAVRFLTQNGDTSWVDEAWYQPTMSGFFSSLTETQAQAVLDNLVHRAAIDTHAEMILSAVATVAYGAVWRFFGARISHKDTAAKGYEPIPFTFHHAAPALGRDPNCAVDIVREWYVDDDPLFEFTGGKLLAIAFPECSEALRAKLLAVIEADGVGAFPFVADILKNYQGRVSIHPVCQALIECVPEGDTRWSTIEVLLLSMGVVGGEFGMVEAYREKRDQVASWLNDPRPKVRRFAERYVRALNREIAAEQRECEERLQQRKLDWEGAPV